MVWGVRVQFKCALFGSVKEGLLIMPEKTDETSAGTNEGIQQYYISKIEELHVSSGQATARVLDYSCVYSLPCQRNSRTSVV